MKRTVKQIAMFVVAASAVFLSACGGGGGGGSSSGGGGGGGGGGADFAPASIAGGSATVLVTSGSGGFVTGSYSLLPTSATRFVMNPAAITSVSDPFFGSGSYVYTKNSGTSATLTLDHDAFTKDPVATLTFTSAGGGTFTAVSTFGGAASGTFTIP